MQITHEHMWLADPNNPRFEVCSHCRTTRMIKMSCRACRGRGEIIETHAHPVEGEKFTYSVPCGRCDATGFVPLIPPRIM